MPVCVDDFLKLIENIGLLLSLLRSGLVQSAFDAETVRSRRALRNISRLIYRSVTTLKRSAPPLAALAL
jgi:hypothetical protein